MSSFDSKMDELEGKKKLYSIHSIHSLNTLKKDYNSVLLMVTFLMCEDEDRIKIMQRNFGNEPLGDILQTFYKIK